MPPSTPSADPVVSGTRPVRTALDLADIVLGAAWIAVCATGPEFIWRGARLVARHFEPSELWTAIPLGLLVAFFVEPLLERLRSRATTGDRAHHAPTGHGRGPAFHALSGIAFAACAILVHDAMSALAAIHGPLLPSSGPATAPAIALALSWALTPFAVSLSWWTIRHPAICALFCVLAAGAPVGAGLMFDWSRNDIVTTALPCIAILFLGLHRLRRGGEWTATVLKSVAQVAASWLAVCLLLDLSLDAAGLKRFALYSPSGFWMDVRFYAGWIAGLWLVPRRVA
ncbi:hypothetical protein NFI95_14225 [Acetobacteraceae bacterium KSS8]|uniref:DUF998 domain-containing protein n=1 Tax=Endosaccharibacter trunci TaxID=2812733 RepID=A0ABT1W9N2_9PROT|nr:hypothetical protein [Acetobacteraceae bacterium KSS8]